MIQYAFARRRRRAGRFLTATAAAASALALFLLWPAALPAQSQDDTQTGTVRGRIVGDPAKGSLQGATVVLLRFELDAEGKPKGGPIARQTSDEGGRFTFGEVPIRRDAVYQLGTRVDGQLVGSEIFTFPEGERAVVVNLMLDEMQGSQAALRAPQAIIALEPQIGATWVTEVLHLENPGAQPIPGKEQPLQFHVPEAAESLEMLRQPEEGISHEQMGTKLLVYGDVPPGMSTVAFRYRVSAGFGGFSMTQRYPVPVENVTILTPADKLSVGGAGVMSQGTRTMNDTRYRTWSKMGVPAETAFRLDVSGVPVPQTYYLFALIGFAVVMSGVVVVFWRGRLRRQGRAGSDGDPDDGNLVE